MSSFLVTRCIMKETTRYDDVYARPYTSHFDGDIATRLMEATDRGQHVSIAALSGIAGSFLRPQAAPSGSVMIENGFGEKRLSFMLEVKSTDDFGSGTGSRYIITGYSDHLGAINKNGDALIDPHLKLYINNIFVIRDTITANAYSNQNIVSSMIGADHVFHTNSYGDYMRPSQPMYLQRPEDVFGKLQYANDAQTGYLNLYDKVEDGRNRVDGTKSTKRRHEIPSAWLNDSIRSFISSTNDHQIYDSEIDQNLFGNARDKLRNSSISSNPFVLQLTLRTSFNETGYVTYSELCNVLPNLDHENNVLFSSPTIARTEYQMGQGESWRSVSEETIASSIIKQSVPAIMSDCLITSISFTATNDTIGGEHVVSVSHVESFTHGLDMSRYIQHFIDRLKTEILTTISRHGYTSYNIQCTMNMLYDSHIHISINGSPLTYFAAPSFCDNLYSPIVTFDSNAVETMAHDVETMLHSVTGDLHRLANDSVAMQGIPGTNSFDDIL